MRLVIATLFVSCFFITQSSAQLNFGVKGGLNIANVKGIGSSNPKARIAYNAGLFTEIHFIPKIFIRPEVLYSVKGYKFDATTLNGGGTLSFNYISVPLLGGIRANKRFAILVGPEFNFLMNANSKFDGSNHDVSKNYRRFDMAIDLGVTCHIILGLSVEARYSHGFEDLADVFYLDQNGNITGTDRVGSNRVFSIGAYFKFSQKR